MNTKTDRFYRPKAGGYFSETSKYGTSFNVPNPNHIPRDSEQVARDLEKGRPLWLSEINKNVPAGATYEIESTFGAKSALMKTRGYVFLNNNPELNKTAKEEPALHRF